MNSHEGNSSPDRLILVEEKAPNEVELTKLSSTPPLIIAPDNSTIEQAQTRDVLPPLINTRQAADVHKTIEEDNFPTQNKVDEPASTVLNTID